MSSYADLTMANVEVAVYRNYLPLDALLMYTPHDLKVGERVDEQGQTEETYSFRTRVDSARKKLNVRGIDLPTCRRWYEQFRSEELLQYNPDLQDYSYHENPLTFERYLATLQRIFEEPKSGELKNFRQLHSPEF